MFRLKKKPLGALPYDIQKVSPFDGHAEASNFYVSYVARLYMVKTAPNCPKLYIFDESPTLTTSTCQCSVIVLAPPNGNRIDMFNTYMYSCYGVKEIHLKSGQKWTEDLDDALL